MELDETVIYFIITYFKIDCLLLSSLSLFLPRPPGGLFSSTQPLTSIRGGQLGVLAAPGSPMLGLGAGLGGQVPLRGQLQSR